MYKCFASSKIKKYRSPYSLLSNTIFAKHVSPALITDVRMTGGEKKKKKKLTESTSHPVLCSFGPDLEDGSCGTGTVPQRTETTRFVGCSRVLCSAPGSKGQLQPLKITTGGNLKSRENRERQR